MQFIFNYNPANIAKEVTNGVFPNTVRTYRMNDGNIGNTNYTIIPYNSPNKAAALVLQNVLLSGEAQLEKAKPSVWVQTLELKWIELTQQF